MIGVFVTGTDTGCGKTAVACALAEAARVSGARVRVLKPIETGCEEQRGERHPADAHRLAAAAGDDAPVERICPYRLALAAAPEIAAREERVLIELEVIESAFARAARDADLLIVEGAGGLLVPIAPGLDMAGLARHLRLPLIVVARASLGTLNHTQLTLEAARGRNLSVHGVIVSHTVPDLPAADLRNLELLKEQLPVPLLAELSYGSKTLEPAIDLAAIPVPVAGS